MTPKRDLNYSNHNYVISELKEHHPSTALKIHPSVTIFSVTRIFYELLSRDHEDGCATWQPQGVGLEAYLNGTSQGPTPEDARKDGHIRGRSK